MFKRIDHTEIVPANYERTIKFYTEVLGFQAKQRKKIGRPPLEEIIYLTLGDTMVEVMSVKSPAPVPAVQYQVGYKRIALEVDDMDKAIAYLKSKGVTVSVPPVTMETSRRAEIVDPDGLSIELRQWMGARP